MSETSEVRARIELERGELARAITELKTEVERKRRNPISLGIPAFAGAAVAGFVLAGGVRGTLRLLGVRERRRRQAAPGGLPLGKGR